MQKGFAVVGIEENDFVWLQVEDLIKQRLAEEKVLDEVWVFENMYESFEIKKSNFSSSNTAEYTILLDLKKYFFSLEKRQSVWFIIEFREIKLKG